MAAAGQATRTPDKERPEWPMPHTTPSDPVAAVDHANSRPNIHLRCADGHERILQGSWWLVTKIAPKHSDAIRQRFVTCAKLFGQKQRVDTHANSPFVLERKAGGTTGVPSAAATVAKSPWKCNKANESPPKRAIVLLITPATCSLRRVAEKQISEQPPTPPCDERERGQPRPPEQPRTDCRRRE